MMAGTKLGPYEIVAPIGAGGMGEVFKARDTRLDRTVAVKISAEQFTERFEREARAVAALNHPHICTLYDVGPNYLVMEYIEGPTLAERIRAGAIPLDEALPIARQIAEALEAAHEKGIVHRDLKPANIKLTTDGKVKVLDFGLAAIAQASQPSGDPASSPTLTLSATRAGMILGTAGYMSPEQANGRVADRRADIWSFGAVLYEMLTGSQAFAGESVSDTLASVLKIEPDWRALPRATPPTIRRLVERCLTKDRRQRLQAIGEARITIEEVLSGAAQQTDAVPTASPARRFAPWAATVVSVLAALALAFVHFREQPSNVPEPVRFEIAAPAGLAPEASFAVSPDGRRLAFMASGTDGASRLWIRDLDSLEARPLSGSEGAAGRVFFWSPDSSFLVFNAAGKIKKIDLAGGPAQTLCDYPVNLIGGSCNRDEVILLGGTAGIMRIPASGGTPVPVTIPDASTGAFAHVMPSFLPDGRHFVYLQVSRNLENRAVLTGRLDAKPGEQSSRQLLATLYGPVYLPPAASRPARLLFLREGVLLTQAFDHRNLQLSGDPVPVAKQVGYVTDRGFFSASTNGVLVYRTGMGGLPDLQLSWLDRQGKVLGKVGEPGPYRAGVALSPKGTYAAAGVNDRFNTVIDHLWLFDLVRGANMRFGFGEAEREPVWSPDGTRVAYRGRRSGMFGLYQKLASGAKDEELLLQASDEDLVPLSWSRDGGYLLYRAWRTRGNPDLWVLPLSGSAPGDRKPFPFADTKFKEDQGRFSPDAVPRWVAYVSDESGHNEVYVREFSPKSTSGGKWLVSKRGGSNPLWRGDGKELFYIAADRQLMAVEVTSNPVFQAGTAQRLFQLPAGYIAGDVAADGKRFLFALPAEQSGQTPFTVVLNWEAGLRK